MPSLTGLLFGGSLICARLRRLFEVAAAGTLTRADLRRGITRQPGAFNNLRQEVFGGLAAWERKVFGATLWRGDRILVVGSGTGRELIALAAQGYDVTGIEPSPDAVALSRKYARLRGVVAPVLEGFVEDLELPGTFDVVIFTHRSYGLIVGATNRIASLRKCRMVLNQDGRVIVSYESGRGMSDALLRIARLSAALGRSDLRPERGDDFRRLSDAMPCFGYEHYFRPGEFEGEARMAGLHVEAAPEGGHPVAVLTPQTRVRRTALRLAPTLERLADSEPRRAHRR